MQSTTGSVGGSRARVIYHAPGKSFAWLHKDGSFADLQKALRARLNISKNEPLVIEQIDGSYTLDIETEEEYEAFCHFAKSAPQLHISVNGGLRDQLKAGEIAATSSSTSVPVAPLPPQPSAESEDLTLGKRKASQITADPEATPSVTQKRKKRRKVAPDRSTSAPDNSTITAAPPEPETERGLTPGDSPHDVASTNVVVDVNQPLTSQTRKKKKRKTAGVARSDPTAADVVEQPVEPSTVTPSAPEPPPAGPSKAKKRTTVVVDLATVIPPLVGVQEPLPTLTAQPPPPVTEPPPSTAKEVTKKPPARKRAKVLADHLEPTTAAPPVSRPNGVDEPVSSSVTTKPKPPKRKTGQTEGSSTIEKETKQQDPVKTSAVAKPKGNPRKSKKAKPTEQVNPPDGPNIQEIMDGVIAAAMENAKKRGSTSGATTDVSENFTPPPQNKSEPTVGKPRLVDASSLEPASSTTLLGTVSPAATALDSDSAAARKKVRTRKSHAGPLSFLKDRDGIPLVQNVRRVLGGNSPVLPSWLKSGDKPVDPPASRPKRPLPSSPAQTTGAQPTAPPPNRMAMWEPPPIETQPEGSTSSEDEDYITPKKKPAPISDPDDELDAFLHAPAHPSQRSVLEELPSDSEDEEDEVEREDMEVDEEEEAPKPKWSGHGQLKMVAGVSSPSDDDSDSESIAVDALVTVDQVQVNTQATHVSETSNIVPSSDPEDEGEPLSQPANATNTPTDVVASASTTSDSPEHRMIPISDLKSAGQVSSFFNEHVLDKPDPIESDPPHATPLNDLPEDAEDPIENADITSTPKSNSVKRVPAKGRNKTASPTVARKNGAGPKATQSNLTSPLGSMLPPPTPSQGIKGDFTFSQPLGQSTPAVPGISRMKQLTLQTTVPGTPSNSAWTTLPQREPSTQSMDDPVMVDELISSPTDSVQKLPKATPLRKRAPSESTNQTPLFLPATSQFPIPSSDLPAAEGSSSEESEEDEDKEKIIIPPSPRVLRSRTPRGRTTTPYRSLSLLASQRSIFPSTPIEPMGPAPFTWSQTKLGTDDDDDDDDEEDSGVSDSDSPPPSHIPKDRRAGAGSGNRGKRKGQLAMLF